jgi:membrane fusion protein (multidrug efflux system)
MRSLTLDERLVYFRPTPMRLSPVFLLLLSACGRKDGASAAPKADEPAISVQTAAVEKQNMPQYLTVTGIIRASAESEIAADAAGKVTSTTVERCQRVKKGDLLVTLDAALSANAAEAQSHLARTQLEQARRDCERSTHLFETGAISKAEYDRTAALCESSQWSAAAANAQERTATKVLGDMLVRAPFDGVIGERYVNVGQYGARPSSRSTIPILCASN